MRLLIQKALEEYWEAGGFPKEAGLPRHSRTKTHREYFHTTLFLRGVAECSDVSQP